MWMNNKMMSIFLGKRNVPLLKTTNTNIDASKYLKKDGSDAMKGNLDLGGYIVANLKTYPQHNKHATSKKYVDDECKKLLDLNANRQMEGDLDMNDNSIIGIYDITADNSAPSKKYVKDELAKRDTKLTANTTKLGQHENIITRYGNDLLTHHNDLVNLKAQKLYSHYSYFQYSNPVQGVYKEPLTTPVGNPRRNFYFSGDVNDQTSLVLLGLECDTDTTLSSSASLLFSCEAIFYKSSGYQTKVVVSGKNLVSYRCHGNTFAFGNDLSYVLSDLHSSWAQWKYFTLKIAVPWGNNETTLHFAVSYK